MAEDKEQDKELVGEHLERCVSDNGPAKDGETVAERHRYRLHGCKGAWVVHERMDEQKAISICISVELLSSLSTYPSYTI